MNIETITTVVTSVVGVVALAFGVSKDKIDTINEAIPSIVGGVMSLVSVIALLKHKRLARTTVFENMIAASKPAVGVSAQAVAASVKEIAKSVGLI